MPMPKKALDLILVSEGGYSNDPLDRGGSTNMGVTQGTLDAWRKYHQDFPEDVQDLSRDHVAAIYERQYWQASGCERIPWPVSLIHFDMAVNSGNGNAVRGLQRTINRVFLSQGKPWIQEDGGFGPKTEVALEEALKIAGLLPFGMTFIAIRREFYKGIVRRNPKQVRFLKGWLNRLARVEKAFRLEFAA